MNYVNITHFWVLGRLQMVIRELSLEELELVAGGGALVGGGAPSGGVIATD